MVDRLKESGMEMEQKKKPLYDALVQHQKKDPISFHVPGHKFGRVYPDGTAFESVLHIDATEVSGLDDLHAPEGVIKEAQDIASHYFGSLESFFLVNGSTVGNLAMVLATCHPGDQLIVQRNCHKSVLNGLELAGAEPIFVAPEWEEETNRYSVMTKEAIKQALDAYPDAKGVLLTYPDYFGRTYALREVAECVHDYGIPLLVDEAHGIHFHMGAPFPEPALQAGADVVVQSAHKMAPAMTMASFLHVGSDRVNTRRLKHYLQMLQSSSPSYPLMASLDLARHYMAGMTEEDVRVLIRFVMEVRDVFRSSPHWNVPPLTEWDDPLKLILEKEGSGFALAEALESVGLFPELATSGQVLLTFGLGESFEVEDLKRRLMDVDRQLKKQSKRATIKVDQPRLPVVQSLALSFSDMIETPVKWCRWQDAEGEVAAEAVLPYPPGIAVVLKGERISRSQIDYIQALIKQGASFQNEQIEQGIMVFKGEWK
ncbi:aminotransferase class I/II-fold pyridoxal phosphate-dependent enzyme [Halobacillus litoralis]|uniref:aminotransferase class I/II-fold pyridoxal phosphate-dependent enzyme n=1 Tax=Halobacillus litoralis TaxID=45668 RepID=UPI001CD264D1|nr:aminotransferase class I/II-fold pyridoxal phosphate-dependent enzyme [Halobacillus litoralis]MCA0972739.1 aminotransferase class I/II-fold pyridoxal phosphate-dependent enzyme [Halobacillus litoralis]